MTPVDLNGDGLLEYRLENDKVRVTLLAIGARVIEYVVKERNDNVLFKLWPEKEPTDRRPFRERGFYPYGGFEDFLGQASIETHKVYDAELVRDGGTSASVRMTADYYGNRHGEDLHARRRLPSPRGSLRARVPQSRAEHARAATHPGPRRRSTDRRMCSSSRPKPAGAKSG